MKQQRKLFAILTLVAFMMTLLPMAAFAATTNTALTTPAVQIHATNEQGLGNVRIVETEATLGSIASGAQVTVTLPSGVTFPADKLPGVNTVNGVRVAGVDEAGTTLAVSNASRQSFTFTITRANDNKKVGIDIVFGAMLVTSGSGPIEVDIMSLDNGITSGKVVIGTRSGGANTATVLNVPSVGEGVHTIGTIRIVEDVAGSIANNDTIKLELPDGLTWVAGGTVRGQGGLSGINYTVVDGDIAPGTNGRSILTFKSTQTSSTRGFLDFTGLQVRVGDTAELGDIEVKISGTAATVAPATVVVAKKVDFSYTLNEVDTKTIYAGAFDAKVGAFTIKESSKATIYAQGTRTIRVTLPDNAVWQTAPLVKVDAGSMTAPTFSGLTNNRRTAVYNVADHSTSAATLKFYDGKVSVRANANVGDLKVELAGTAGVAGEVKVAEIVKPIAAEAEAKNVIIGLQGQEAADILIKEVDAEVIKAKVAAPGGTQVDGVLVVVPQFSGVTFTSTPKVKVIDGNLKLDEENVRISGGSLIIPIDKSSTVASTIKISGIKVTTDRSVPEGPVQFRVRGNAINHYGVMYTDYATDNTTNAVAARVVTPAPGDTTAVGAVKFALGSMFYAVDDVEAAMDIAPYAKNGRTYLPIRFAATATGISNDNVIWNSADQTVTIINDARVIQLKVGSNVMTINGTQMTMDAAPEINGDRTMLPIRFVAQALGKTVDFNDETKEVTIK